MKIAVISDIHANLFALEAVVKEIKRQKVDSIVCLGDLVMTGSRPAECYSMMESLNPDVWIKGNTDDWFSEVDKSFQPANDRERKIKEMTLWSQDKLTSDQKEYLISLPISKEYNFYEIPITFCHGSPFSYSQVLLPDTPSEELDKVSDALKTKILICGHSHIRFSMPYKDKTIINFGSVSIPGEDYIKQARYGIIHNFNGNISFQDKECDFDLEAYRKDLIDLKFPDTETILSKYGI